MVTGALVHNYNIIIYICSNLLLSNATGYMDVVMLARLKLLLYILHNYFKN